MYVQDTMKTEHQSYHLHGDHEFKEIETLAENAEAAVSTLLLQSRLTRSTSAFFQCGLVWKRL